MATSLQEGPLGTALGVGHSPALYPAAPSTGSPATVGLLGAAPKSTPLTWTSRCASWREKVHSDGRLSVPHPWLGHPSVPAS